MAGSQESRFPGGRGAACTLYVYPTALKARSALRDQARVAGCLIGHRVTTYPELTDALARDLGVAVRVLEPHLAAVVLEQALAGPGVAAGFRDARIGVVRELLAVLGELEAAYLGPDDVRAVARELGGPGGARLAELAGVYSAYAAALARLGAVDRHGRDWRVAEALGRAESADVRPRLLQGVERVVFAEIYDFSILQFLIATSVIRIVGDAELVAFGHGENVDATRFLERTWNRFVGDAAIADNVLPSFVMRGGRQGSLAAVLRSIFTPEPEAGAAPDDGAVRVLVAPDRYREVEAAVRDIRRRLAAGARPERMALLARDMTVYGDLIDDVCRRYRVPVRFRRGEALLANGLVKACLDVLRCAADGFPHARLAAVLDTDYLRASDPRLLRTLRRVGFVAETARPLAACLAHALAAEAEAAADPAAPDDRRASAARRHARLAADGPRLLAVAGTLAALQGDRTVAGHVARLRATLRRLGLRPVRREASAPDAARRDARAWERLEETLAGLAVLTRSLGGRRVPPRDFVRVLLAALESQRLDEEPAPAGVHALSVLDARGLDFDVVYLLGMDDGTFPAPRAESPLWSDALKRQANPVAADVLRRKLGPRAAGLPLGGLLRTAREASLEDPFLFFLALSMAEREIVLSYPAVDERGNPTVPSPFLDELRACFTSGPAETRIPALPLVPEAAEAAEVAELIGRAALGRASRAGADRLSPALRARLDNGVERLASIDRRAAIEERRSRYFLLPRGAGAVKEVLAGPYVGRLAGAVPDAVLERAWSPTTLETLGACGFKFYARSVLGLEEDDEPAVELVPREQGQLLHRMLEEVYRALETFPADAGRVRELLARRRDALLRAVPAKDEALLAVVWGRLVAAVAELVAGTAPDAGVEYVRQVETAFTIDLPPVADEPTIRLAGRPDLTEVQRRGGAAVGVRVVDYKGTRNRGQFVRLLDPAKQLGVTGFQIPVYLLGVLAGLADVDPEAALEGGYVFPFLDGTDRELVRPFTRVLLDDVVERVRALVRGARAGHFDVDPAVCDPHCAYRPVCRYQRPPLEEPLADG